MGLRERMKEGKILVAEGYLFEMERRGWMKAGPFVPEVVLDHPEALRELHREFAHCGSDVVLAFTYYAHRDKLKIVGREDDLESLNRKALRLAREVADEYGCLMAGNICNTWVYDPSDPKSWGAVREMYREQVAWAKEEGADYIVAETLFYLGEARIALEVIRSFGLPAVVTLAPFHKESYDGYPWPMACRILELDGADVVGLNCGMGPATMLPLLRDIRAAVSGPLAALPVPYRTTPDHPTFQKLTFKGVQAFPVRLEPFLLVRDEVATFAREALDLGVDYLGLCCGGAPHYIRSMAEAVGRSPPASRYSPDMSRHAMLGDGATVRRHNAVYRYSWE